MLLMPNGDGFSRTRYQKNKAASTKPQSAQTQVAAVFVSTVPLETDVLSNLRVSDEASTLPSDLCIQQSKVRLPLFYVSPLYSKTDSQFWVQDWLLIKAKSASAMSTARERRWAND